MLWSMGSKGSDMTERLNTTTHTQTDIDLGTERHTCGVSWGGILQTGVRPLQHQGHGFWLADPSRSAGSQGVCDPAGGGERGMERRVSWETA